LLKDASNAYVWAYQRVNGTNQSNSPFVLYSLNPTNTYVSLQVYDLNPNQIVGITDPNSNVVITNTSNNQTFTRQSNSQGSWFFTPVNRANSYIFKNANQVTSTLTSTYSFRYPQSKYTLSTNTPILIKPRQNGTNQEDQRSWRISPKLPEGLKFSGVTGIITGTPIETSLSTTYNIWSNSEVFLSYRRQLTIEIV
jgi:hypothetical protein